MPYLIQDPADRARVIEYLDAHLQQLSFLLGGVPQPHKALRGQPREDCIRLEAEIDRLLVTRRALCGDSPPGRSVTSDDVAGGAAGTKRIFL